MEKRPLFAFGAAYFTGAFSAGLRPWYLTYVILISVPILCIIYGAARARRAGGTAALAAVCAVTAILPVVAYCHCAAVWKARDVQYAELDGSVITATLKITSPVSQSPGGAARAEAKINNLNGGVCETGKAAVYINIHAEAGAAESAGPGAAESAGHGSTDSASPGAANQALLPEYGSVVNIRGKLVKPARCQNEYLFDYQRYLYSKGVSVIINTDANDIELVSSPARAFGFPLNPIGAGIAIRDRIERIYYATLPEREAALMTAILTGKTDMLDENARSDFESAGLLHVVAVSGLHIAIVAGIVSAAAVKLGFGVRKAAVASFFAILMFVFIAGFSPSVARAGFVFALAGVSRRAGRARDSLNATGFAAIALLLANPMQSFDAGFILSFASVVSIGLLAPALKQVFYAVKAPGAIKDSLCVSASVCAGCYPILAALFHRVSAVSPLSNLICAPLIAAALASGIATALAGFVAAPLSGLLAMLTLNFIWAIEKTASLIAKIPFALQRAGAFMPFSFAIYYITLAYIAFIIYKSRGGKQNDTAGGAGNTGGAKLWRNIMPALVAGLALSFAAGLAGGVRPDEMEIVFLDVGNANAAYINVGGRYNVIVDAGGKPSYSTPANGYTGAGARGENSERVVNSEDRLYEYLSGRGVGEIHAAIATHGDNDHIQGFWSIFDGIPVRRFILPITGCESDYLITERGGEHDSTAPGGPIFMPDGGQLGRLAAFAATKGAEVYACAADEELVMKLDAKNDAHIRLYIPSASENGYSVNENDRCLIAKIVLNGAGALFCGDIGFAAENALTECARRGVHTQAGENAPGGSGDNAPGGSGDNSVGGSGDNALNSVLMSVPHHGSKYSSGEAFIAAVSPAVAVASVGKNNYGHPAPEAVQRYANAGVEFIRTDTDGMIKILCGANGINSIRRYNDYDNLLAWQRGV